MTGGGPTSEAPGDEGVYRDREGASGLVFAWDGFVWFLDGAVCGEALDEIPARAIRVFSFGEAPSPAAELLLRELRVEAAFDPARPARPGPTMVHHIVGDYERRSMPRFAHPTHRHLAIYFRRVTSIEPCP